MPADLTDAQRAAITERMSPPARIVHEVVRQQAIEERERPTASLIWSASPAW